MISGLKRAKHLIETCGWVGPEREPMCATMDGRVCFEVDEAVASFSVSGALLATDCYPAGWDALESVVAPNWTAWRLFEAATPGAPTPNELRHFTKLSRATAQERDLQAWLREPQRTTAELLRAFVRAIERGKKMQGERR